MPAVRNWLGNVASEVDRVFQPRNVEELQKIVAGTPGRLLVFGSRMSKTSVLAAGSGSAIDMRGMNEVLDLGPETVTVQAGITLYELHRALYAQGRQLPGFTITVNPSIGGCISAPTKGPNQPFIPGSNSVSSAIVSVTVVRPSGEVVVLRTGEHDPDLALLKDSYGTVGVVVEATLRTVPLVSAEVYEEIVPLDDFVRDEGQYARALDNRVLLLPKLGYAMVRVHRDLRQATPERPYEEVIDTPSHPYVSLARSLPRWSRRALLRAAVRLGGKTRPQRKLHIQNLTLYPEVEKFFLDFSQWSIPVGDFGKVLPEVVEFCRAHPGFPTESLVELIRINPEPRFLDSDDRMAFDPVLFDPGGRDGWESFYRDYNRFMVERRASPFLNQTRYLEAADLKHIYGPRYEAWRQAIFAVDASHKLGSAYVDRVLERPKAP
jgi:hypothetical protein